MLQKGPVLTSENPQYLMAQTISSPPPSSSEITTQKQDQRLTGCGSPFLAIDRPKDVPRGLSSRNPSREATFQQRRSFRAAGRRQHSLFSRVWPELRAKWPTKIISASLENRAPGIRMEEPEALMAQTGSAQGPAMADLRTLSEPIARSCVRLMALLESRTEVVMVNSCHSHHIKSRFGSICFAPSLYQACIRSFLPSVPCSGSRGVAHQ